MTEVMTGRVGSPIRLKMEERWNQTRTVRVTGLEPWEADGPFFIRIRGDTAPVFMEQELPDGGEISTPMMGGSRARVTVATKGGVVLGSGRVNLGKVGEYEVKVTPPRTVHVRMYEEGMKKPLKGGQVVLSEGWQSGVLAELGQDGKATFRVPLEKGREINAWSYRVRSAGFCAGFMAVPEKAYDDDEAKGILAKDGVVMHGGLAKGAQVMGRILLPDGSPLVGADLLMESEAHGQVEESHYYGGDSKWLARTDKEGRFVGDCNRCEAAGFVFFGVTLCFEGVCFFLWK